MRDIHYAQAGFLSLMGEVKNAAAIGELLDREALAAVAISVEIVVPDQRDVPRFRGRLCVSCRSHRKDCQAADEIQKRHADNACHSAYDSTAWA